MSGKLRTTIARLWPRSYHPQVVRRVVLTCPTGHGQVEVDLLMRYASTPDRVLHCSAIGDCPTTCGQPCRFLSDAIAGPPKALLLLPPGRRTPHEED